MKLRITLNTYGWNIQRKENWYTDWETIKLVSAENDADLPAAYERARNIGLLIRCAANGMALSEMGPS